MSIQIHSAVKSSSKFLKDLLRRNENLFIFSKSESANVLNQITSYFSKEQSVLLINENQKTIHYKQNGSSKFEDITEQYDFVQELQSSNHLDYVVLDGLVGEDYFPMLTYIYREKVGLIANFKEGSVTKLKSYLTSLKEEDLKEAFSHLDKHYFLFKTLPLVVESRESINSIQKLSMKSCREVVSEDVFVRR